MDESNSIPELPNQRGVSTTTIAVLLILALIITIIGTWAVMVKVSTPDESPVTHNTNVAQVSLKILPSNSRYSQSVGKVVFEVSKAG